MKMVRSIGEKTFWNGYQCGDPEYGKNPYKQYLPEFSSLATLGDIAQGKDIAALSQGEKENLDYLLDNGFCVEGGDGSNCPVQCSLSKGGF